MTENDILRAIFAEKLQKQGLKRQFCTGKRERDGRREEDKVSTGLQMSAVW